MNWYLEILQTALLTVQLTITRWSRTASEYYPTFDYVIRHQQYDSPRAHNDTVPLIKLAHAIDDVLSQIIPQAGFAAQSSVAFNLAAMSFATILIFLCVASTIVSAIQEFSRKLNLLSFFERLFTVIENEFSVPRSLMVIFMLLSSCLLLSTFIPALTLKTPALLYVFITLAALLLGVILLWPISLIYNWGAYFTIYIKGESTLPNLLGQVVMDYFYVVSFFLRINLQFLRPVVLSGVFIVYNEFYFEFIYPTYNFESVSFTPQSWEDYGFIVFRSVIVAMLRFVYELGHMWAVLIMQANAFAMILFLILQSLHTVYLAQRLQAFFRAKRK